MSANPHTQNINIRKVFFTCVTALFRGRYFIRGGYLPDSDHHIPADFSGVGVATSADERVDETIIAYLHELKVQWVRLDVTYGDKNNHVGRFLERLHDAGFKICLHLVQPREAARNMPAADAVHTWEAFVSEILTAFGAKVEMVEIGSTINRQRWSGYTMAGFLRAWECAYKQVRSHDILLAGPNITDFEPLWTTGVLTQLQERHLLPDIYTNNLFSERCFEPERWDHKIMGQCLAPIGRFNLVHKARLIARLGADAGVNRTLSPSAFWTLPRIRRFLTPGEEKQADYLSRYMILCAVAGVLEGAWWGPILSRREGLVDSGYNFTQDVDRITFYADVSPALENYRIRPAFYALRTFNSLIAGATVLPCNLPAAAKRAGLEIHAFAQGNDLIHAVWTHDAHAAACCDIYAPDDLNAAIWLDRDGSRLDERPDIFSERPVFLRWDRSRTVQPFSSARPLPGLNIHRYDTRHHYYHRDSTWHGMVLAANRQEAGKLIACLHPDAICSPPTKKASLRHARNVIWTIDDPRNPGQKLTVKKPVKHHVHKKILDRFKPSKARRSWNGSAQLLRRGIASAQPVAWFEQRSGRDITRNWYICAYVEGNLSVGSLFSAIAKGLELPHHIDADNLYASLAAFLHTMHNRGIYFRDLSGGNILVNPELAQNGAFGADKFPPGVDMQPFILIDTGRIHCRERRLSKRKRLSDLTRACHKLHRKAEARSCAIISTSALNPGALCPCPSGCALRSMG